jgi:Ca-activated chloride channel family protein
MTFLWPEALWLLAIVPLLAIAYVALLARSRRSAVRYANLAMVREAMTATPAWKRHLPPALFLLAIALMIAAVARPAALVTLPSQHQTIILAMDVSGSMRATDVQPNRLAAAQAAAKAFVDDVPDDVRLGVVSFAATASVVQAPTHNREDVHAAIDRFQLQRGTALGSGILVSLSTLFPDAAAEVTQLLYGREPPSAAKDRDARSKPKEREAKPVPPGSFGSAAVILLTDGQRTTGPDAMEAAKMAADRGVRIYTVGIGTLKGEVIGFEGWSMRVKLDEDALKSIANVTRGEYFYAGNAAELKKIYRSLNTRLVMEKKETEVTSLFAAAAGAIALLAAMLSLLWFNRIL